MAIRNGGKIVSESYIKKDNFIEKMWLVEVSLTQFPTYSMIKQTMKKNVN